MKYLTTTTSVKALTSIRRVRLLPRPGEVNVRTGQEISPVQIVARTPVITAPYILDASKLLGVPGSEVAKYLLVEEGAVLRRGTPLIRKTTLLGRIKQYSSPTDGVLHQIRNGRLIVRPAAEMLELRALIPARVVTVLANRGVTLETNGTLIQAMWDSGKDGYGKIIVLGETPGQELSADAITAQLSKHIVVAGTASQAAALERLEENGVQGLIVGSMTPELCQVAPMLSFPVAITDGVGQQPMAESIFQLLQQSEGREAALFAATSGPRGQNTEIIIPMSSARSAGQPADADARLLEGSPVRVSGLGENPRFGEIIRIHPQPMKTAYGSLMQGADVLFADGRQVFIPIANLDLLI